MPTALPYRPILETLVSFDTTSRNSNLDLIAWIEQFLDHHGVRSHRVVSEDGSKANLYATAGPMAEGGIILSGHTDVVPVDGQPWTSDPWKVHAHGDRLIGRGVADMKGFVALALAHVPLFKAGRIPVHLAFSYDEEVGCLGAPSMIEAMRRNLPPSRLAIIGEPTGMRAVVGHKGSSTWTVAVTGHEAHSSLVNNGVSANMVAIDLMAELARLARQLKDEADPDNGFDPPEPTLTVGMMHGGTATNILAGEAGFAFDLRCPPGVDPDIVIAPFLDFCADRHAQIRALYPECGVEVQRRSAIPALFPTDSEEAVRFVRKLTGDNSPASNVPYAAEAGQFQRAGFSAIVCGPGSIEQAHQPDEWIAVAQLERGARFMQNLAIELA